MVLEQENQQLRLRNHFLEIELQRSRERQGAPREMMGGPQNLLQHGRMEMHGTMAQGAISQPIAPGYVPTPGHAQEGIRNPGFSIGEDPNGQVLPNSLGLAAASEPIGGNSLSPGALSYPQETFARQRIPQNQQHSSFRGNMG